MAKSLCDLKDQLKTDPESYVRLVLNPTHICKKCGRVANNKKVLCSSLRLKKIVQQIAES